MIQPRVELRRWREAAGLSREELALGLKVTADACRHWESGHARLTPSRKQQLRDLITRKRWPALPEDV